MRSALKSLLFFGASLGALQVFVACTFPQPFDAELGCPVDAQSDPSCRGYVAPKQEAGATEAGQGGTGGLGASCGAQADCAGKQASYCVISPVPGQFDSFCSIPSCTASTCTGQYDACCDCSTSSIPQLSSWKNLCFSADIGAALRPYGCTCVYAADDGGPG
jgi:hypothetical protein